VGLVCLGCVVDNYVFTHSALFDWLCAVFAGQDGVLVCHVAFEKVGVSEGGATFLASEGFFGVATLFVVSVTTLPDLLPTLFTVDDLVAALSSAPSPLMHLNNVSVEIAQPVKGTPAFVADKISAVFVAFLVVS